LFANLSPDRQQRIDADAAAALAEMERADPKANIEVRGLPRAEGSFRWKLVDANGQVLAASAEAFRPRSDCLDSIDRLRMTSPNSTVEEAA
jgi:uncharacterized protein YegP (UPF0339 family)